MNRRTLNNVLMALVVAGAVFAAGFGFSKGGSGEQTHNPLFIGAVIGFVSSAIGLMIGGGLQAAGQKKAADPKAKTWSIGFLVLLTLVGAAVAILRDKEPASQLALWIGIHFVAQLGVHLYAFRGGRGEA